MANNKLFAISEGHKRLALHALSSKIIQLNVPLISKLFACVR